jgi:HemY protein
MLGMHAQALRTARALAKHGGFSADAASRLMLSLALASVQQCRDGADLMEAWKQLNAQEQRMPSVGLAAAEQGLRLGLDSAWVMDRLHAVWTHWMDHFEEVEEGLQERILLALLDAIALSPAAINWLERAEQAHLRHPRHAQLLAFYGLMCQKQALWGKAQSTLEDAARRLSTVSLKRRTHAALASLAESRNDSASALKHWRMAALS